MFQDVKETFRILSDRPRLCLCRTKSTSKSKEPAKEFARKKILQAFFKFTLRIVIDPHPPLFFSSPREQTRTLPALSEWSKSPSHSTVAAHIASSFPSN